MLFRSVPVVAARSGGLPETIEPGVNGEVFAPGDAAELADKLAEIASDPERIAHLSAGALKSAEKYLTPRIAAGFDAVFASLGRDAVKAPALYPTGARA